MPQARVPKGQPACLADRDPNRFFCPYEGCNRSFAELWRLKVHYRAPPDVRGSGKERGHGCELQFCPKCGKELKAGKHHVGCYAGRAAPRHNAAKRMKMVRRLIGRLPGVPAAGTSRRALWLPLTPCAGPRLRVGPAKRPDVAADSAGSPLDACTASDRRQMPHGRSLVCPDVAMCQSALLS